MSQWADPLFPYVAGCTYNFGLFSSINPLVVFSLILYFELIDNGRFVECQLISFASMLSINIIHSSPAICCVRLGELLYLQLEAAEES